jgi:hypothetical protein
MRKGQDKRRVRRLARLQGLHHHEPAPQPPAGPSPGPTFPPADSGRSHQP